MKQDLLKKVRSTKNLESAWRTIQENGRSSKSHEVRAEISRFQEDSSSKLRSLSYRLARGKFSFPAAKGVPIPKLDGKGHKTGKVRPIVLAPVESRIVQRAILNVLIDVPALKPFVKTKYSFGGIRSEKQKRTTEGQKIVRGERISAVPAAIKAVLDAIEGGTRFVVCGDIQSFFTRISKPMVTEIIAKATNDSEFTNFFSEAIRVELENLEELRKHQADWPIEDIGVAQGNSLSPLLGNIVLAEFDQKMNEGDCRCIRYIDDIVILAPTMKAANARLARAEKLLAELGMTLSPEKTLKGGISVRDGFDFLGINFCPGAIRPSQKAQKKFLTSIDTLLKNGKKSFNLMKGGKHSVRPETLLGTLKKLDAMIDGWGKHYWFCNDDQIWRNIDAKISEMIGQFLGLYRDVRERSAPELQMGLLGISELIRIEREPFSYPSV
ncbi:reverse transcriptase domain-containing protein [Methylovirgula sp. 4M-Z18]|uniref:reverse transcriptase domain-containing protein n=1 Tax=Methylovirgula sp. 4M-Z18 TaxID=2293567 RepID=UPI000E2F467F|nr:reverse transcriptase domain-containing protein [Methylovirgula sp. 4M-Z18]RFB78806.1 RNA-dependent DNA polymerase [Methylovirgula sp. 4M-Z18]